MSDLISRQAALDALKKYEELESNNFTDTSPISMMTVAAIANCIEAIVELPSAEPERKKGRWIPVDSYSAFGGVEATWMAHGNPVAFYYCSNCKEQAYSGEDGQSVITDFCPNCGADMSRGEK